MIELSLFRTGAVDIARGAFAPWLDGPAREERTVAPVWSALLRTPDGNILFDTGLHPVHVARPEATFGPQSGLRVVMEDGDAIVARLASLGVRPDDISIVVNSHLHFDHAGNNGAFPNATFIVQADHLAFAKGRPNFPGVYWDIAELSYDPVS
ncbi:MAG TPA: MBL fold metallo-hydrolase, partial [Candidatus Limnocylindria bacterium]|nr:MBL fold metallo-hydrolase [Candidatus Limnocylindria bacterium]